MKTLINFYAAVSEVTINNLINIITQQIHDGTKNIEDPLEEVIIQISSSGGSSDHGLLAYNYLTQLNIKKTTIGMGNVDSAAVMIFAAGEKRLAMPSCRFVLHEALTPVQGYYNGSKLHEIASLNERITKDYCRVIAKVTNKTTSKELASIENKVKNGQVMSSEEAEKYGIVTHIQEKPYLTNLTGLNIFMINTPQQQTVQPKTNTNQSEIKE